MDDWSAVFGAVLALICIVIGTIIAEPSKSELTECLQHQKWCVEHYELDLADETTISSED